MHGECNSLSKRSSWLAGLVAALFCGAVCAAVTDLTLPSKFAASHRPAAGKPVNVATAAPRHATAVARNVNTDSEVHTGSSRSIARLKVKCAGCGVIESVRRIEVDERSAG